MPRTFTNEEYADIHYVYGFCDGNAEASVREYGRRFPTRRLPSAHVFIDTPRRFREVGLGRTRNDQDRNNNPMGRRINNRILRVFDINRRQSTRRVARQLHLSQSRVWRTLRADHRRPYHLQPVQNLQPGDAEKRVTFCEWLVHEADNNPDFVHKILWTDEASFTRRGVTNYHNLHVWAHDNPHEIRPRAFQNEFSVNVWIGILHNNVCGPHFLPPRLTSDLYHEFLHTSLDEMLDDVPLHWRNSSWMQLDGAPAHYGVVVRQWLNTNYPQRWIGRLGPVLWPPRSPDLNPLDFYLWGTLKTNVYEVPVNSRDQLMLRIQDACNDLRRNPLQIRNAVESVVRRARKCLDVQGAHFEHLL